MAPSFTIDPKDGAVRIAGFATVLCKCLRREEAVQALGPLRGKLNDFGNGYEWLAFQNVTLGDQPCRFDLSFHHGLLQAVHFSVMLPSAELQDGWPTHKAILEEIAFVRTQLQSQLGVKVGERGARFAWGSVWSMFDLKGFQASSGLRYDA